jgi:hypothetical protein
MTGEIPTQFGSFLELRESICYAAGTYIYLIVL